VTQFEITAADPDEEGVRQLIERHLEFGHSHTPLEDVHALEPDALADAAVSLFAARSAGEVLGIGALRRLDDAHAELKAMHTAEHARGRGVGRAMLEHLLAEARRRGYRRVSLETGSANAFRPARCLYLDTGFTPCEPFAEYRPSPNSVYLTIAFYSAEAAPWTDRPLVEGVRPVS
jgi:putative acetyltransferase